MNDIDDLIARLEAATEGSRELDRLIDLEMNPDSKVWSPAWWSGSANDFLRWPDDATTGSAKYRRIYRYTTSVDAALTLMPEGDYVWAISGQNPDRDDPRPCATIMGWLKGWESFAATPALALCIAALKARRTP